MRILASKMASFAGARMAVRVAYGLRSRSCLDLLCRCGGARFLCTPAPAGGVEESHRDPPWVGTWYETLSSSVPVATVESGLIALQVASGLPWWSTVLAATAILRTGLTLPLSVLQKRVVARLEKLQPEIEYLAKQLRYEVSVSAKQYGWSEKEARVCYRRNIKRIVSELYIRDNCHPFKATLLIWVQIPVWIFVSVALRNLSIGRGDSEGLLIQEQFSTGGILWFKDLTLPDSTWILPITLGLLNLLIVEIFSLRKTETSKFWKYATNFFRAVSLLMIPIASNVPSILALYWVSSSFIGLSHNLLLRSPAFCKLCHLPRTKSDSDTPYKDIAAALYMKYFFK
ncbi:cytochrome c oxidase assembly protein COX18, mitochondrial isoform X1 [Pantherophis guttatus]|uniref:Cytochrome c oxidase assembly protein COX18, mitochondrial isoform X1 n=1 Tax=Pantherophis guttatus TaxID=94885 RepID=A0A6P9BPT2_PANGU|nr:cytochrome c oxidase assembly protein COX18, mitochondrial isoform X1 [Pantherophis guttatus]